MKSRARFYEYLRKHWLIVGILCCIFFAGLYPSLGAKGGPLKPEYTVKYGAVSLIFCISGLSLKTESIFYTLRQYNVHFFIQIFTFVFIPIFVQILIAFLNVFGINPWILKGLITVACMPPPVSSAVILTRTANGNETTAIFNSVLGSFLGILITPISLLFNLGVTTIVPLFSTLIQLSVTVLLPLLVGQAVKNFTNFKGQNLPLNTIGQTALLFVIYSTFCDTFEITETSLTASDVLITIVLVILLQAVLLGVSFYVSKSFPKAFTAADVVAITFCSTHKSLTLGIPILRIMFHGYSHLSQISLPLLVYHPTQIILGGFLVMGLKDWVRLQKSRRFPV